MVDPVLDAFTALAAVALVTAALYAALSIREAARAAKYARVLRYMERLLDLKFVAAITEARIIWAFPGNDAQKRQHFSELSEREQDRFGAVLNFFEEVCAAYNAGILDEEMTKRMVGGYINFFWDKADWFISHQRLRDDQTFCEWAAAREHFRNL